MENQYGTLILDGVIYSGGVGGTSGGATIDDANASSSTTWSSEKITNKITEATSALGLVVNDQGYICFKVD